MQSAQIRFASMVHTCQSGLEVLEYATLSASGHQRGPKRLCGEIVNRYRLQMMILLKASGARPRCNTRSLSLCPSALLCINGSGHQYSRRSPPTFSQVSKLARKINDGLDIPRLELCIEEVRRDPSGPRCFGNRVIVLGGSFS